MTKFLQLAQEIRTLVSKDEIQLALSSLQESLKDNDQLDQVILQSARYEAVRKQITLGLNDPHQSGVEKNRIRLSLLELVRELEHEGKADTQVFISYSQKGNSKLLAKYLHDQFEEKGYVAFLDSEDIRLGEDWATFILGSLKASDYFVLLLSSHANESEMVLKEVAEARRLQDTYGKPVILPVMMTWPEGLGLNYQLHGWLQKIQHINWDTDLDTPLVLDKLIEVISQRSTLRKTGEVSATELDAFTESLASPPTPVAPLEIPQGAVLLNSPFYIERKGEKAFIEAISAPKALLRIRGPRQYGKTSLLSRVVAHARVIQYEVVTIDFQNFGDKTLSNLDNLIWEFCWKIASVVDMEDEFEEYWDKKLERKPDRDRKQVAHSFIEKNVLRPHDQTFVVALDEADRIFPHKEVSDEFFLMMRSWHEGANTNPIWERFKIAISYSTEAKLAISNLNASPFNVGEEARLFPFSKEQLKMLIQAHGLSLKEEETDQLLSLLGGQPYLIRRSLYLLGKGEYDFDSLIENAASNQGPFSDHLRHHLINIKQFPDLSNALKTVITTGKCKEPIIATRLNAAGLTVGTPPASVNLACELYRNYFKDKL